MRPRIVVFMGGQEEHAATSRQSGTWACQYIPRSKYDVVPVEVTHAGQWKVPIGTLPKGGNIARTMDMLFQATPPQEPAKALERLLSKPVDSIVTLMRGRGGDDGAMHGMGDMLGIRVHGSPRHAREQAFHKQRFLHSLSGIASTPYSKIVRHIENLEDTVRSIWSSFITPFFVKPIHGVHSYGIVRVENAADLQRALAHAKESKKDVLVQEYRPGIELSVTLLPNTKESITMLPPTIITPKFSKFYDYQGKQHTQGAHFHGVHESDSSLIHQAEEIARDVYEAMGCSGIATLDMIANDGAIDVLDLNTIPSFHEASPIHHQLQLAGMHPEQLITKGYSL